jgi:tRNA A-37 threonylcarbamoyl transferase component Bud32/tetratricopeptide (TPR) repeat protein
MDPDNVTAKTPGSGVQHARRGAADVKPGDLLAGRFLLREILGDGATGTVFSALDRSVGQKVAIKVIHPDLHDERTRERLRREVRASRNGHQNLVAVYDLHEAEGRVFLSMELVEGRSLKDLLDERRSLESHEVVDIGRQVATALSHLHGLGIIHRDVKPGNILLGPDGTAKLCDMGLARPIEEGMTVTETEMVVGTPAYMAPEQGLGADLTAASDVYGLGLTLYQCLTGTVPLTSETAVATLTRRQRERPPAVRGDRPDCPRWLNRLIRWMLEPLPRDRPSTPRVENALITARVWRRPRRRVVAIATAGAAIITVGSIAATYLLHRETVRYEVDGADVHGVDKSDRLTWSYTLPAPPARVIEADLDGDGRPEFIAAGRPAEDTSARTQTMVESYLVALTAHGDVMTSLVPEQAIRSWAFPYRVEINPMPFALDVDADGCEEILLLCQHVRFYPTVVMLYWPRWDRWQRTLDHPGHLGAFTAGTGDGAPGLRFFGLNNTLTLSPVFGEIELVPPRAVPDNGGTVTSLSAAPMAILYPSTIGSWKVYVPLDKATGGIARSGERISVHADGAVDIGNAVPRFRLDRFANPVPGPNQDLDLRARRLQFMNALYLLNPGGAVSAGGVQAVLERTQRDAGPLMEEPSYRLILHVVGARALAAAGDLDGALELLKKTEGDHPDEDLLYLQGHLQAIRGDLDAARITVMQLIDGDRTSRSHFDGVLLLSWIAAEAHDRETAATVIDLAGRNGQVQEEQRTHWTSLWARTRLWWDESTEVDCSTITTQLSADGDAVGCLARWRLRRPGPDDVGFMERSIDLNPDSAGLGRIALAAAHLGRSEPTAALAVLEDAIAALEPTAKYDFNDHQVLELARALQVVALENTGDHDRAAALGDSLVREVRPDVLPGILVREVLDRTHS